MKSKIFGALDPAAILAAAAKLARIIEGAKGVHAVTGAVADTVADAVAVFFVGFVLSVVLVVDALLFTLVLRLRGGIFPGILGVLGFAPEFPKLFWLTPLGFAVIDGTLLAASNGVINDCVLANGTPPIGGLIVLFVVTTALTDTAGVQGSVRM